MTPHRVLSAIFVSLIFSPSIKADEPASRACFNVRSYGATGDGKTLDSPAINQAIDAAAEAGGGTVVVPAGSYLSGSIHLKSNIHLLIDAGAVIVGAPQAMNAYDETEPFQGPAYQDGGHTYFHNSLIWGENLANVFITGHGSIQGGGLVRGDGNEDGMSGFASFGKAHPPAETPSSPQRLGNKGIALKACRNVLIRDITISHGGHFAVLLTGCDNTTVDNVTIDTDRDGVDIDCCRNSTVSNCRINSPNDDALVIKSTLALGRNVPTENLTIVNCQVSGFQEGTMLNGKYEFSDQGEGRIKLGTESNGGYRNVTIANCTFRDCHGLALEEVDGGTMEEITINNLSMVDVIDYPIYITTGRRNRGPDVPAPSRAADILISNVVATGVDPESGIQITGLPGTPIERVRLDNIRLHFKGGGTLEQASHDPRELGTGYPEPRFQGTMPAYGVYARHVRDLELSNIAVDYAKEDLRPAIVCSDVAGLEIDHFKAQTAPGVVPAKFESVSELTIRDSPSLQK